VKGQPIPTYEMLSLGAPVEAPYNVCLKMTLRSPVRRLEGPGTLPAPRQKNAPVSRCDSPRLLLGSSSVRQKGAIQLAQRPDRSRPGLQTMYASGDSQEPADALLGIRADT
jgi:hypothetical protein